jgi:hypothetical protein
MQTVVVRIHPPQPFFIFHQLEDQVEGLFIYVGSTLAASNLQLESTIRSNFSFSSGGRSR